MSDCVRYCHIGANGLLLVSISSNGISFSHFISFIKSQLRLCGVVQICHLGKNGLSKHFFVLMFLVLLYNFLSVSHCCYLNHSSDCVGYKSTILGTNGLTKHFFCKPHLRLCEVQIYQIGANGFNNIVFYFI